MQVNRVGYVLIALFLVLGAGAAVIGFTDSNADAALSAIVCLAAGGSLAVFAVRSRRQASREDEFREGAIRGTCTIVQTTPSGTSRGHPRLRLTVDVVVQGNPPTRAESTLVVPDYVAFKMRPGLVLPAHVDPTDPSRVLVQW